MQSTNQKCNAFESVTGIFLHSCNTPEKVINALARMGISISTSAIHRAIRALSQETYLTLRDMGRTLLVGYAYDNFDIDFKTHVPTIEKAVDTLTHMTSGCMIRLDHGVTLEDLHCSDYLWAWSRLNPAIPTQLRPAGQCIDIVNLHPERPHPSGLTQQQHWITYKFLADLTQYGPPYFEQFRTLIQPPEPVDQIPVKKMQYAPVRAMDINQSKVAGNIQAITELLGQGDVGDPTMSSDSVRDMREYVVLLHGDLGTAERVQSLMERRSIEATPWRRFQFVVFVMGLFHLKMACADAIWRIFIEPKAARDDATSLMHFIALNRPRETGKIGSDPGFRRMHEVIQYSGLAIRLDAWRVEVRKRFPQCQSLEEFAQLEPSLAVLQEIADTLATSYVANSEEIFEARCCSVDTRDKQQENILLMHQYFLLYEELSWSMNEGDIGRVETLFPAWIYLFRATGKHKYARHMIQFLTDVHYVYPEGLRRAVRYSMLVNPTGKQGKFRGVDWVVEAANLDIKVSHPFRKFIILSDGVLHQVTFGGKGSNYTKERVIDESPLIQVYRNCHSNMERNLHLSSPTSAHADHNLAKTLRKMQMYMKDHRPNEYVIGRKSAYPIPDMLDKGGDIIYTTGQVEEVETRTGDSESKVLEAGDIMEVDT